MKEMDNKFFQWFVDHMPKAKHQCPYFETNLLVQEFYGYGPLTCAED